MSPRFCLDVQIGSGAALRAERCVCVCACTYVCNVCMYVCMYACMHACMHACMYVCMHACMYVCMYVCIMYYVLCIMCSSCLCLDASAVPRRMKTHIITSLKRHHFYYSSAFWYRCLQNGSKYSTRMPLRKHYVYI